MNALIIVPYDSGHRARRMGAGPLRLVDAGAIPRLERAGHRVRRIDIELEHQFWTEVNAARRLQQLVADAVREAVERGERPIILSGNCNASIGTIAGVGPADLSVVWLDAHPDLETPDTTQSGFFDGQALATVTGRCWGQITATVRGFAPVPDDRIVLVGGRETSDAERAVLETTPITWIGESSLIGDERHPHLEAALEMALDALAARVTRVYLHIDLDGTARSGCGQTTTRRVGGPPRR